MTKSLLPVAKNGVPRSGCEPNRNNFRLYFLCRACRCPCSMTRAFALIRQSGYLNNLICSKEMIP